MSNDRSFNPFQMAQQPFDQVADFLDLGQAARDLLRFPLREYHFSIPVRMDVKMTAAYLAVSELARKNKLYMRDAAYVIAINRVVEVCRSRGWM